jgi:phage replication-related protein YjqB (UPF0714/DUF867 family)
MSSSQDNLHKLVVNVETGITTKIQLTDKEISIYLSEQQKIADAETLAIAKEQADKEAAEAKATQKAALLNRLGITEEEAKLLLS